VLGLSSQINPAIRVCFRVGDQDAAKLAEGFNAFSAADLRQLGVGEAICRIERSDWDFNLRTRPLREPDPYAQQRRDEVVARSRAAYGGTIAQLEVTPRADPVRTAEPHEETTLESPESSKARKKRTKATAAEPAALPAPLPGRGGPEHKYLQSLIKRLAQKRGFEVAVEKMVLDGHGHVDVALQQGAVSIACEISVTTRVEHEVANLMKCLAAGYQYAVLVSSDGRVLDAARELLADADDNRIRLLEPDGLIAFLDQIRTKLGEPAKQKTREATESASEGDQDSNTQRSPDSKRLLIAKDAAAYVGLATQTLAKLRVTGGSPPYFKVGRQVLHDKAELDKWLDGRRRRNTSESPQTSRPRGRKPSSR